MHFFRSFQSHCFLSAACLIVLYCAAARSSSYRELQIRSETGEALSQLDLTLGEYAYLRAFGFNADSGAWEKTPVKWEVTPGLLKDGAYTPASATSWHFQPANTGEGYIRISLPHDSLVPPGELFCMVHDESTTRQATNLSGYVTGSDGNPVENALAILHEPMTLSPVDSAFSSPEGRFYFDSIPAEAPHYLSFAEYSYYGYPAQYWCPEGTSLDPVFMFSVPTGQTMTISAALEQAPPDTACYTSASEIAALEGVLYDPNGQPIEGAMVMILAPGDLTLVASAVSERTGAFNVLNIPGDLSHYIRIEPPTNATYPPQFWSQTGMTDYPEYRIHIPAGGTHSLGSVFLTNTPRKASDPTNGDKLTDITVAVITPDGKPYSGEAIVELESMSGFMHRKYRDAANTNPISFYGIASDAYAVRVIAEGFPRQYFEPTRNTDYPVYGLQTGGDSIASVTVRLTRIPVGGHRIEGKILDEWHNPAVSATVRLFSTTNISAPIARAEVLSDGSFSFDLLPEDEFFLQISDSSGAFPKQWLGRKYTTKYPQYPVFSAGMAQDRTIIATRTPINNRPSSMLKVELRCDTGEAVSSLSRVRLNLAEGGFIQGERTTIKPAVYTFDRLQPGDYAIQALDYAYPEQFWHPDSGATMHPVHFMRLDSADTQQVFMTVVHDPVWTDPVDPPYSPGTEHITAYFIDSAREEQFGADGLSNFWTDWTPELHTVGLWPGGFERIVEGDGFDNQSDAFLALQATYGKQGLYFLIRVMDNDRRNALSPSLEWMADGISIYLHPQSTTELYADPQTAFYQYPLNQLTREMRHVQVPSTATDSAGKVSLCAWKAGAANAYEFERREFAFDNIPESLGVSIKPVMQNDSVAMQEWFIPWRLVSDILTASSAQGAHMAFGIEYQDEDDAGDRAALSWPHGRSPYEGDSLAMNGNPAWGNLFFGSELPYGSSDTSAYPYEPSTYVYGKVNSETGDPLPQARVSFIRTADLFEKECSWLHHVRTPWEAVADSAGCFVLTGLPAGDYYAIANASELGYMPRLSPSVDHIASARLFTVSDGDTINDILFKLPRGAAVTGFVKSVSGEGLSNIHVSLYEKNGCRWYETVTSATGKFILGGIPAGEWHVDCYDNQDRYFLDHDTRPRDFSLSAGQQKLLNDIILAPGGRIHGVIAATGDLPSYGHFARVYVYPRTVSNYSAIVWPEHVMHVWPDSAGFVSNICPTGNWRFLISPLSTSERFEQYYAGAKTLMSDMAPAFAGATQTFSAAESFRVTANGATDVGAVSLAQGYSIFGDCIPEQSSASGDAAFYDYGWYSVSAFVKEGQHYYLASEAHALDSGAFELPGLVDGQDYYLAVEAHNYPHQWWSPDSGSTYEPAAPWRFTADSYQRVSIPLSHAPSGTEPYRNSEDLPDPVYNVSIKPAGLNSFVVAWPKSSAGQGVSAYTVYRLPNVRESDFTIREGRWEPVNDDSLMERVDSFYVKDTVFVDHSVTPLVPYMYVVAAVDTAGREGMIDLPGSKPLSAFTATINYASFRSSTVIPATRWHMAGAAGLDTIDVPADSSRYVYRWNERIEADKLYGKYQRTATLAPTEGVWIHTSSSLRLTMTKTAFNRLVANREAVAVTLTAGDDGWNQIASPFPYPVRPSWLGGAYAAWAWDPAINGYREATVLEPWQAYWVRNAGSADTILALDPRPALSADTAFAKKMGAGWELSLTAANARGADTDNRIGVIPPALARAFRTSSWEPPRAFDFPRLYLARAGEKLSRDFRCAEAIPGEKIEWKVAVESSGEQTTLTVSDIESIPEQVHLFWADSRGVQNLRENAAVSVPAAVKTHYGYVIATANSSDIALYKGALALRSNYPNPFKRSTAIEFVMPYAWSEQGAAGERRTVSLKIYNARGQLVATLVSGMLSVGQHRLIWNGRADSGGRCSSGLYVARLVCGKASKTIRMFKVH